jgi:hypothetical protein
VDASSLPAINTRVDVLLGTGATYPSRVEGVSGDLLQVAAPHDQRGVIAAGAGAAIELAWLRDGGRVAAPALLTAVTDNHPLCWEVRVTGAVRRQTRRGYVRGGGGETIRLAPSSGDGLPVGGMVIDIGEASVRARLRMCDFSRTDTVDVTVELGGGDGVLTLSGRVLEVRQIKDTGHYDIIVAYEPTEAHGRMIRGYVLRRQLQERRRKD